MTQEEKAKAYDEALERARKVHRNYKNLFPEDSYSEDIEEIFPELRESDSERIRKKIIDIVKAAPFDEEKDVLLDWLEKQKEQNLGDKIANAMGISSKVCDGEQKPVEWSEEDEKIRRNLMSLLADMRGDRITEETYQKYYPWLSALRPGWKPTEEQMEALQRAIDACESEWDYQDDELRSLLDDIKKL